MAVQLGFSEHHQEAVLSYLKFARFQRAKRLKVVGKCFSDVRESRLGEETYTVEEVCQILDDLRSVLTAEVESELINAAHTNMLLLQQLFRQAEQCRLQLQVDVSELEDGHLIEGVQDFENHVLASKQELSSSSVTKLDPLEENQGLTVLLRKEVERLKAENAALRDRLKGVEGQASDVLKEKSQIAEALLAKENEMEDFKEKQEDDLNRSMNVIEDQMRRVKVEMEESLRKSSESQKHLEQNLVLTKKKLLEVQAQLDLAEKELERKFSQTSAYSNLKKILLAKNDQIKELRTALAVYKGGQE